MAQQTDPAAVIAALKRARGRNKARQTVSQMSPAQLQWNQELFGRSMGSALPRDPAQFLEGTFTPLTPIEPVGINWPEGESERAEPRQREMPPGWNMPVGQPGTEGFKLASFQTLRTYADVYSVARACVQVRKGEIRGLEWDIMPTEVAEKRMRGDAHAHREFAERKAQVVKFFRKPDPDYLSFGSYIDAIMEEMLVTDALSLYLHPTAKRGGYGPFGKDIASLEIISGSTIRPLVNSRGGRVRPPSPAFQQYLYGVPRVDLMQLLMGSDQEEIQELGKPAKQYRGDQLLYLPYTQRSWTPYGFPPLERTLIPTITGLRKQQYQLDYFDEGTIPGNYISPGEQLGWTPNQLQIWQDQQNALAGDPAYKHKSIALPPGSKVFPVRPVPLADQFDEIIMSQVCMGYDVMPMEMGISPKVSTTQSPGAANQMAKATEKTNERKSLKPTLSFLTDIFNVLIQVVWMQEDMRFVFEGLEEDEDENQLIERLVQMLQYGLASIDECRIALNKPPWGLPITSDPVYVNPTSGMVPLGSIDPLTGKPIAAAPPAAIGAPPPPGGPGGPPGVGGAPKPAGAIPAASGAPKPGADGTPAGKPSGPAATGQGPPPGLGPDGKPLPPVKPHPDDKVGQAHQQIAEDHAKVQSDVHAQFAAGKPMEPPVRPPVSAETEDPEHPSNQAKPPRKSTKAMLSELDALCRHTCKGRDPVTWEARHLPPEVLDYYVTLAKSLDPNDAAAITHQFIISAFGPPILVAKLNDLDKTFNTGTPMNSQDGQQGLAPMQMDGSSGGICRNCGHTCPHQPGPTDCPECPGGHCSMIKDNGGTVDQNRQGGLRQDQADMVVKATTLGGLHAGPEPNKGSRVWTPSDGGDADPKAPLPLAGRVTRDWPGWKYDLELAAIYADRLDRDLAGAVSASTLAAAWLDSAPESVQKAAIGAAAQRAWGWLVARGYDQRIQDAVARVLTNLWTEGFAVGRSAGKEMLDSAYTSTFWDKWKPGDPDAARLAAGPGLQKLLQDYGVHTIRSVVQTRMTQLANVLAAGFEKGDSAETIAAEIEPILRAPRRARMIAVTELARATTQAAVAEYRAAGQEGKKWSATGNPPDNRVCPRCKKNAEQGTIPMGVPFESGDEFTPGHPECRCAILPDDLPDDTWTTPGVLAAVKAQGLTPQQLLLVTEDLSKGLTLPQILAYVAPHLVPSEGPPRAGKRAPDDGEFVAGGLAIRAKDTGRVLMIQRAHDEDDPAGGYWEFPGGRLDPGESVEGAARREWAEETGLPVPAGRVVSQWDAGPYRGHVLLVESENAAPLLDRAEGTNPDDPDNDSPEAIAWWNPSELKDNPAVRPELRDHPKRVRRALEAAGGKVDKGILADLASSLDQKYVDEHNRLSDRISAAFRLPTGDVVYRQLLQNYPPDSIAWVKRAKWRGPYLVSWAKVDHDDMDKWAASHEPAHVKRFEDKIEAGERINPVVLVADPDGNFIDVDGHHRAIAFHNLNRPILGWVGVIDPADREAMEQTHNDQVHEGASLQNKSIESAAYKSWHDAWMHELRAPDGRWIRGGDHPGPTITFNPSGGGKVPARDQNGVTFRVRHGKNVYDFDSIYDARDKHMEIRNRGHQPKLGYAPGHDARHVSLLAKEVKAGVKTRQTALQELSHSAALREKLERQLGGTVEEKTPPRSDAGNHARLENFIAFYRDASDRVGYLKRRSKVDLESIKSQIAKELPESANARWVLLDGMHTLITNELNARKTARQVISTTQPSLISRGHPHHSLDDLERLSHEESSFKTYLRQSTSDELTDLEDEISARRQGASAETNRELERLQGGIDRERQRMAAQRDRLDRAREARENPTLADAEAKVRRATAASAKNWKGTRAEFGGAGQLEDDESETAKKHLDEFEYSMPAAFKARLRDFGTTLVATVKPVGGVESDLANVQPRGYAAGMTWKDSAGAYRPDQRRLIMGNTVGHGSTSAALHEGTHALDHALGYPSDRRDFDDIYKMLPQTQMSPYYTKKGNPTGYHSEIFAELGAAWLKNLTRDPATRQYEMSKAIGIYVPSAKTKAQIAKLDRYYAKLLKDVKSGTR